MKTNLFDYHLPKQLIAQTPLKERDQAKLLVLERKTALKEDKYFYQIIEELKNGDVLVLNNTKVIPARLFAKKVTGALIEILLLKELDNDQWECLLKPAKKVRVGDYLNVNKSLKIKCIEHLNDGRAIMKMEYEGIFLEILETIGRMPTPPYIHEKLVNNDDYQTVYAKENGSAAAPTAGFHFTKELLAKIKQKGVIVTELTLHVGLATFRPVKEEHLENHQMHHESYHLSLETVQILNQAQQEKRRIIAVGTTSLRALEANYNNGFNSGYFDTNIFIFPPYQFKAVDALITNFHLPKSTLLMLVSAFASREEILACYEIAIKNGYRFFSFGDAMFIK